MRTPLFWRDDAGDWMSIRIVRWRMQRYRNWKLPPELAAPIVVLSPIAPEFQSQLDADCPELATGEELRQGAALLDEVAAGGEPDGVFVFKRSHLRHALWYGARPINTALQRETLSLPCYNESMKAA